MKDPVELQRETYDRWMTENNMMNTELARKTGLGESTFRNYRTGVTRDMTTENKYKAANALNLPIETLFGPAILQKQRQITGAEPLTDTARTVTGSPPTAPIYGRVEGTELVNTPYPVAYAEITATMAMSPNVFAVRVPNTNNMPRFRMREILIVNPDDGAAVNEDCVIITKAGAIHILQCKEYSPARSFYGISYGEPAKIITIAADDIEKIGRIVYVEM